MTMQTETGKNNHDTQYRFYSPDFFLVYFQVGGANKILDIRTTRNITKNLFKRFWNYPLLSRIVLTACKIKLKSEQQH
jgi:hypothetical protein